MTQKTWKEIQSFQQRVYHPFALITAWARSGMLLKQFSNIYYRILLYGTRFCSPGGSLRRGVGCALAFTLNGEVNSLWNL